MDGQHETTLLPDNAQAERCTSLWPGIHVNTRAAIVAGLVAGTVFLALEMITAGIFGAGTPFGPAHVTLEGLAGAQSPPGRLDPGLVLTGGFLHYVLSVLVTIPLAAFLHPWGNSSLILAVSGVLGCALYFINVMLVTPFLSVLHDMRDLFMIADYAVFGMVAAWSYKTLARRCAGK